MSSIVEIYTEAVRDNLRPLFANWEPGTPLELGDYGLLNDDCFIHIGNIKDLGIKFNIRKDETKDNKSFASKGSTDIKFGVKGSVNIDGTVNTKATLELAFSSEESVFFNAAECYFQMIEDKAAIGKSIMNLYKTKDWDRSWAIVTDIVQAGATTIAISGGKSSSIIFEAVGDVNRIDLADASIGMNITSQKNIGYVIEAKSGLIPLIGLSKIQSTFLWFGDDFKPLSLTMNQSMLSTMRNSSKILTEESDDLYFGQIK
jgi:hypothetical protein